MMQMFFFQCLSLFFLVYFKGNIQMLKESFYLVNITGLSSVFLEMEISAFSKRKFDAVNASGSLHYY